MRKGDRKRIHGWKAEGRDGDFFHNEMQVGIIKEEEEGKISLRAKEKEGKKERGSGSGKEGYMLYEEEKSRKGGGGGVRWRNREIAKICTNQTRLKPNHLGQTYTGIHTYTRTYRYESDKIKP